MKPTKQGDFYTINIDDAVYQEGVAGLQDCLIGRIIMSQGDTPYSTIDLEKKLYELWHMTGNLELIPLNRGYYTIRFSFLKDRDRVFKRRNWLLQPGLFRLQNWVQDFNPNRVRTSLAQVLVRISDLPMEYWQPGILEAMASAFGNLLKIDDRTLHRRMGHYARILVEIDIKTELIEKIMYKRAGICSFANLVFERLPEFCRGCGVVGHTTTVCTRGKKEENNRGRNWHRSTSRNRSASRRRDYSAKSDQGGHRDHPAKADGATNQNMNNCTNDLAEDVLHGNFDNMHGNKILALPPIPTKNTFEALGEDSPAPQEETTSSEVYSTSQEHALHLTADTTHGQQPMQQQTLQADPDSSRASQPYRGRGSAPPRVSNTWIKETSIPTGSSLKEHMNKEKGSVTIGPTRDLKNVVENLSTSAQEPFTVGAMHEQNIVAKAPWADAVEQVDSNKPTKHGYKNKR
ncbi:hypothetical protein ACS0TY_033689 [Phlomoides rotata]